MSEGLGAAAVAGVVERPRLFEILDSSLIRVCVVQGPSGSGKTTLLRNWVARQHERAGVVLWVSLSERITSRDSFWRHVVGSAVRHGDLSRETAAEVGEQLSLAGDPVRIAIRLLADAGPVTLILDAYEHLGDATPQIDADLARLLAGVSNLRVLVTTRGRTELMDLPLSGDGFVRVIAFADLVLTAEEIGTLLFQQAGIEDRRLVASLANVTGGFPLTVRAVVLALSQLSHIPRVDSMEWSAVAAAKLESLLPDPVVVQFVTDTSVPPYVDVRFAELLSENPDAAQILEMLERNGFGRWIPYRRDRCVFQYVEIIRDTFRARASDDAERFSRACVATARWLLENEEVVDHALQFAIDGEDYALADRIFVSLVISNPDSYISDRFLPVLQNVPEQALADYPMLAFGLGLALMANPVLRAEAPRIFTIAVDSPSRPSYIEAGMDAFTHASMRAVSRRLALSWRQSAEDSMTAIGLLDAVAPELLESFAEHVGTILRQLSFSLWQGDRIPEAIAAMERSVALCRRPAPHNYSMVYVACVHAFTGDTARSALLLSSIDAEAWPPETRQTPLNALGLLAETYVHLDALDFAAAAEALHDTRLTLPTSEFWPLLTAARVVIKHGVGQAAAEADRVTRELTAAIPPPGVGDNVATECLHAVLAMAWLAAGDRDQAERLLDAQPTSPYTAAARVALASAAGRPGEALRQASRLLELPGHTIRTRAETQLVGAVSALARKDHDSAWEWLTGAAAAWEAYGTRAHVALLSPRDHRLLLEFARERESSSLQLYLDVPASLAPLAALVPVKLTPREQTVLAAIAEYDSARATAEALFVSPHTVKTQLQSIYRKLGVSSRDAALFAAERLGLLDGTTAYDVDPD